MAGSALQRFGIFLVFSSLLPIDAAHGAPFRALIVGRVSTDAPWTDQPTEARLEDKPELAVVLVGKKKIMVDAEIDPLILGKKRIPASKRLAFPEKTKVRWWTIEPHAWRREGTVAKNGVTARFHSNVSLDPATFGKWLGYDEIEYFETEISEWSDKKEARRRPAAAKPSRSAADRYDGLGTIRYKAAVDLTGKIYQTKGIEAVDQYGILPAVHRVSIRSADSFVGYLESYFMVPEIFGSAGAGKNNQTDRFVGADCADVLTGALRSGGKKKVRHANVAGLTKYARVVEPPFTLDEKGATERRIPFRRGDLVRINYGGALAGATPRSWDHVAVVYRDKSDPNGPDGGGPDGSLDGYDLIVHMGHPYLVVEPLVSQAPAQIDVMRWKKKLRIE